MARKKGLDVNAENDKLLRAGLSALYKDTKKSEIRKELLKDDDTKAQFMKFLFNESDFNPLK
jgi:hypothetical protein